MSAVAAARLVSRVSSRRMSGGSTMVGASSPPGTASPATGTMPMGTSARRLLRAARAASPGPRHPRGGDDAQGPRRPPLAAGSARRLAAPLLGLVGEAAGEERAQVEHAGLLPLGQRLDELHEVGPRADALVLVALQQ